MPDIQGIKYTIGSGDFEIATVTVPMQILRDIEENAIDIWMKSIAKACPLYAEHKKEIGNHAQVSAEPVFVPVSPF